MKKLHILSLAFLFISAVQAEEFSIVCSAPQIQTLNRFEGSGTVVASKNEEGKYVVESSQFEFTITPAGFSAQSSQLTVANMKSNLKYIESEFTQKPFYQLTMAKNQNDALLEVANILLDYPKVLDSSLRIKGGMTFKSSCSLQ